MIEMREAADPANLHNWDGPVGGYPNHQPPWTEEDFGRFSHKIRVSVRRETSWARTCRVLDVEAHAAVPSDAPGFVHERERQGFDNATLYFSLAAWPAVRRELDAARIGPGRVRLWIAHWTGRPRRIGPDELGPGWEAWAHQFADAGPFTQTGVWGRADFSLR